MSSFNCSRFSIISYSCKKCGKLLFCSHRQNYRNFNYNNYRKCFTRAWENTRAPKAHFYFFFTLANARVKPGHFPLFFPIILSGLYTFQKMRCQATGMPGWMSCSCHCQGNQQKSITCTPLASQNLAIPARTWPSRQIITWQMFNLTMGSGKTRSRCGIILQHRIVNLATERVLSASSRGSPMPQDF